MTDPNRNEEARKRKNMREKAGDMSNLELLKWSGDWIEENDLDKAEKDELAKCYKKRVNRPESFDMSDNS